MSVVSKSAESRTGQSLSLPAYSIAGLAGVSFRHEHLAAILAERGQDVFFDVRAVNYRGSATYNTTVSRNGYRQVGDTGYDFERPNIGSGQAPRRLADYED